MVTDPKGKINWGEKSYGTGATTFWFVNQWIWGIFSKTKHINITVKHTWQMRAIHLRSGVKQCNLADLIGWRYNCHLYLKSKRLYQFVQLHQQRGMLNVQLTWSYLLQSRYRCLQQLPHIRLFRSHITFACWTTTDVDCFNSVSYSKWLLGRPQEKCGAAEIAANTSGLEFFDSFCKKTEIGSICQCLYPRAINQESINHQPHVACLATIYQFKTMSSKWFVSKWLADLNLHQPSTIIHQLSMWQFEQVSWMADTWLAQRPVMLLDASMHQDFLNKLSSNWSAFPNSLVANVLWL